MVVEIRLYKRFDTDLVALLEAGYPVAAMMKEAVCGFANGRPVRFFIDEPVSFNPRGKSGAHIRFIVPERDAASCYLLRNITSGYRNTFCKEVLRNSLVQQLLSCFFADPRLNGLCNQDMSGVNLNAIPNLKMGTACKNKTVQTSMPLAGSYYQTPSAPVGNMFQGYQPGVMPVGYQMPVQQWGVPQTSNAPSNGDVKEERKPINRREQKLVAPSPTVSVKNMPTETRDDYEPEVKERAQEPVKHEVSTAPTLASDTDLLNAFDNL